MKRAQDWAIRLTHEAKEHEKSIFVTLTFSNPELAKRDNPGSVDKRDIQKFIKRLRIHLQRKTKEKPDIRYFSVGEYGEETGRPHYHILIFGYEPHDGVRLKASRKGSILYTSELLSSLWTHGHINYGNVTWDSASYCAGYITKKFNNNDCGDRLTWIDPITGEKRPKQPEFSTCSRNPPIGHTYLQKHYRDFYENDYVVVKGKRRAIPRSYDEWYEKQDPEHMAQIRDKRQLEFLESPHITEDRRLDIHLCRWEYHTKRIREAQQNEANDLHDLRQQSESVPKAILHAKRRYRYENDS